MEWHGIITTSKRNYLLFRVTTIHESVYKPVKNVETAPISTMNDNIFSLFRWLDKLISKLIIKVAFIGCTSKVFLILQIKQTFLRSLPQN